MVDDAAVPLPRSLAGQSVTCMGAAIDLYREFHAWYAEYMVREQTGEELPQ